MIFFSLSLVRFLFLVLPTIHFYLFKHQSLYQRFFSISFFLTCTSLSASIWFCVSQAVIENCFERAIFTSHTIVLHHHFAYLDLMHSPVISFLSILAVNLRVFLSFFPSYIHRAILSLLRYIFLFYHIFVLFLVVVH